MVPFIMTMHDIICPAWSECQSPDGLCHIKLGSTGNYDVGQGFDINQRLRDQIMVQAKASTLSHSPCQSSPIRPPTVRSLPRTLPRAFRGCIGPITLILHGLGPDVRPRARVARSNRPSRTESDSKSVLDCMSHVVLTYLDSARTVSAKSSGYRDHVLREQRILNSAAARCAGLAPRNLLTKDRWIVGHNFRANLFADHLRSIEDDSDQLSCYC
jgi:hypothetical protein